MVFLRWGGFHYNSQPMDAHLLDSVVISWVKEDTVDFCESTLDPYFPFSGEMSVLTALSRKQSSRDFFFFLHLTMMELEHAQKLAEKQIEFYLRASPCTASDPQSTPWLQILLKHISGICHVTPKYCMIISKRQALPLKGDMLVSTLQMKKHLRPFTEDSGRDGTRFLSLKHVWDSYSMFIVSNLGAFVIC